MTTKCNMLVVDDEPSVLEVVATVLSGDGYHVDTAQSAEEALELFVKGNYPLLVSDIVLPGMSGIDLLKKVKQINADTQIIMMTSQAMLKTSIEAIRYDAYDYLLKPFDDLNIISIVAQHAVEKVDLLQKNRMLLEDLKMKNDEATRMNAMLRELAIQDGLTGLCNHRYFQELLVAEVERSKRYKHSFSLIFISVDHFIKYNDTHGPSAADQILRAIADLLKNNTRKSNVVARCGLEEFGLIMPEITAEAALVFAERIRALVADHPFVARESQPGGIVSVSIGVAAFPRDGIDRKSLLDHAGRALLEAKNSGRNKVC
jgi:diguanylate cyclase (GGDEF)-like protein